MTALADAGPTAAVPLTVSDLTQPAPILAATTPVAEVDRIFRRSRWLRAIIVDRGDGYTVLTREHLQAELTGPMGYGRALHTRAVIVDLVPRDCFTLAGDLAPSQAARLLLSRPEATRYDDVLVLSAGLPRLVTVSRVFEQVAEEFRFVALHDPLTGLPNRRFLEEHATRTSSGADAGPTSVLYIDLDGFKLVNDTYGHRIGDLVLIDFAQRLRQCLRPADVAARLGGDEFVAMTAGVSDAQAATIAERILLAAATPFVCDDQMIFLSASVGIVTSEQPEAADGQTPLDVLLRNADAAMLSAKTAGRARIGRLDGRDGAEPLARRALLTRRLQEALSGADLELVYQPQLDLATGRLDVVEALARWSDPVLGPVSPSEFVAVAEASDQINRLGRWVIDTAAAQAAAWMHAGTPRTVSINVSPRQLGGRSLLADLAEVTERHSIPPSLMRVEITETRALTDAGDAIAQLAAVRDAGYEVELDDFGTGFSSLARLRRLPVSTIKIDKGLIDAIDCDPGDRYLIGGLIDAAHYHGLRVTAEGVERAEQLDALRELGCDSVQGYYVCRPVPAGRLPTGA